MSEDDHFGMGDFVEALQRLKRPIATTSDISAVLDRDRDAVADDLTRLAEAGSIGRRDATQDPEVWYPIEWEDRLQSERVVCFPDRRELIVDQPEQFTRAQLSQIAHLAATTGDGGYLYRIRPIDVWYAPYETLEQYLNTVTSVLQRPAPKLIDWIISQWDRSNQFRLITHPDGYTVLQGETPEIMGNVARQILDSDQLHAPISETESWVVEGSEAVIKQRLGTEGFPVRDERELDPGEPLDLSLTVDLRPYQREWVETFLQQGSGVFIGPPGSGKTIAALGVMARIGGETLILVPGRELAGQWRNRLLSDTDLDPAVVGEYHGGVKQRRPVTIATYHVAAMERHRALFDERHWGLIIFDETHHIPADIYRRAADLQGRYRLGLSASPVRGDDREDEIFTLIGPPIGTDWAALIDEGFVVEPTLELRLLSWGSDEAADAYAGANGHERRREAAMNPAKLTDIEGLLQQHAQDPVLIFVDWLDQGRYYAERLNAPFISGETRHAERERHFEDFRAGKLGLLIVSRVGDEGIDLPGASVAILASGLGGSRRQGTQRAGRTMRPAASAMVYVLATRGTEEEDFARNQLRHLQGKGMQVTETVVDMAPER